MDPLKSLLNIADVSKNTVQVRAKSKQEEAKKQLGVLSDIADTSTNVTKTIAQKKAFPVWLSATDKIQNLANIPKITVDSSPFKFDNLLWQSQGGMPNLSFTQMWTQKVEPKSFTPSMPSITQDAQMIRNDAVSRITSTDDKVLKIMDTYNIDRNELFDLWKFTRQRLEEAGEDTTWLDDIDIAEYALDTAPEKEKQQYMRSWVLGTIQWAFQEWAEKQAQARARTDVWMQSWLEWFTQATSATPWVVSDLLWDVTMPIISKAWELWQEYGAELGNIIRPLVWKEMLDDTEKEARIQELNQRAAQQWGNAIVPLMKEYAKLDTRTQKNLESLLPYLDLWVWVWWSVRAWEQIAKSGIKEWIETWLKKWATMISDIKAHSIKLPKWVTNVVDYAINQSSWLAKKTRDLAYNTPEFLNRIQKWEFSKEMLLDEVKDAITTKYDEFSELGKLYEPIKQQAIQIDVTPAKKWINWVLQRSLVKVTDKWLDFSDSAIANSNSKKAVIWAYNTIMWRNTVTPEVLLNVRKQLDDLIDYWSDVSTQWQKLVKEMRREIDNLAKKDIPWLKELDTEYAPIREELSRIKKDYFNKDWSIKDTALSRIANIANESNVSRLQRLERIIPDIKLKAESLKAFDDIISATENKVGTYVRWWAVASALFSWNPLLLLPVIASEPRAVIRAMKKAWETKRWINKLIWKVEKWQELTKMEIKDLAPEIDKIIKANKDIPQVKAMTNAIVPVKEWPLESRWYTQKLVSPKREITEINPTAWKTYTARDVLEEMRAKKNKKK